MGLAVFESSLPTGQGTALYKALQELHASELVLGDQAQLIFLIIQAGSILQIIQEQPRHLPSPYGHTWNA